MKTIVKKIFLNAVEMPDKVALFDGKRSISFSELCKQIIYSKKILVEKYKLGQGDAVIIAADKQLSFVSVYFACHLAGIIALPIASDTNQKRFQLILQRICPKLIIGFDYAEVSCEKGILFEFEGCVDRYCIDELLFPELDSVADVIFTTGTTGEPKGVQLTHKNIAAAAKNINSFIGNSKDDIELLILPISHSFGLGRLRCALSNAQTIVVLGSFANIKRFFRFIEEYHVTGFGMVPANWAILKKFSGTEIRKFAEQLHYIEIGSAPMTLEDKKLLLDILPKTRICMHYGLTEASRSTFIEFHEEMDYLETIGKESPNMHIAIFDEEGNVVPFGTEGEICVQGDAVTIGYYNLPDVNRVSFWGNYFRTGDWGVANKDGYIKLCSRKKELINIGGKKVSPLEVEDVLLKQQEIQDCACIAIPDPEGVLGEVVKAFVVTVIPEKIIKDTINHRLAAHLEAYKLPVEYEVIDKIPRTNSGKVQRLLLKG